MEFKDEQWISEASNIEKIYEQAHKRGNFLLVYQLSLSSAQPLQEDQVKTALIHLYRKCPAFRVCYGQRNGKTWLRYMKKEDLDFQIVKDTSLDAIRDSLQSYQYNSEEGPLWCSRLLFDTERDPLALDEDLPHTSHLFLGIHHGITDGLTMIKACSGFVRILNDVIECKPICDQEQIGYFLSDTENRKLVDAKVPALQQDPSLMQELKSRSEEKGIGIPLLHKVEPPPGGEDKTNVLMHVVDKDTTKRFIEKCKAEKVTLNSGFSTLVNAAIVPFLVDNQYVKDSYKMNNGHVINLRRYWPADRADAMGCHALTPLNIWIDVPKDYHKNFWDSARALQQELHHHLKEESVILREAYIKLTKGEGGLKYEEKYSPATPKQVDCVFSNLGDVTHSFEDNGPHVKPYLLARQTSLHRTDIRNFAYFFHTLRSRLIVCMLYNTKFFTKATVQRHCDKVFSIMENVISGTYR